MDTPEEESRGRKENHERWHLGRKPYFISVRSRKFRDVYCRELVSLREVLNFSRILSHSHKNMRNALKIVEKVVYSKPYTKISRS